MIHLNDYNTHTFHSNLVKILKIIGYFESNRRIHILITHESMDNLHVIVVHFVFAFDISNNRSNCSQEESPYCSSHEHSKYDKSNLHWIFRCDVSITHSDHSSSHIVERCYVPLEYILIDQMVSMKPSVIFSHHINFKKCKSMPEKWEDMADRNNQKDKLYEIREVLHILLIAKEKMETRPCFS